MIVVGGYVDLRACEKEDRSLVLDQDRLKMYLPFKVRIPLTIEHLEGTHIGWVCGIYSVSEGLFMLGVISSPKFLDLLRVVSSSSSSAKIQLAELPSDPLLDVLHAWLPGLSLSSVHPDFWGEGHEGPVFNHVSLCALGKRRGTVAVYGHEFPWVLSKFISMSENDRALLGRESQGLLLDDLRLPVEDLILEPLLAKAIDASFIRDRLDLLRKDKHSAHIHNMTYLKASADPLGCRVAELNTDHEGQELSNKGMASINPPIQTSNVDDVITVPRSLFMSILQTRLEHDAGASRPYDIMYGAPHTGFHGGNASHHVWSRPPMKYEPWYRCPPSKHKRSDSDSDDELIFPGEELPRKKRQSKYMSELKDLIKEVKDLRSASSSSTQSQAQAPTPTQNAVYYAIPGHVGPTPHIIPSYMYTHPQVPLQMPKPECPRAEPNDKPVDNCAPCTTIQPHLPVIPSDPKECPTVDASVTISNDKTNVFQKLFCQELLSES
ncbi:putative proteinase/capsid scaffold protein [Vombatid gammaherpesvirus 1]|uniref:Capsid scaffolding protein n=1 Tax=Vombatid gammaherpesvirus 1 TaxID=2052651 RepID=A0A3S5HA02_9GAMA|nr:putative proteinase/capsid scaffold protein [Vombatid gammaherpesvirus 1]AZB49117.1 putative proteinase/capsid scaffold protein [Vombatid gammaherpesvirus 1]